MSNPKRSLEFLASKNSMSFCIRDLKYVSLSSFINDFVNISVDIRVSKDTIEYIRKKTKKEFSLSTNLRNSSLSVKIFVTFPMLIGKKYLFLMKPSDKEKRRPQYRYDEMISSIIEKLSFVGSL